MDIKQIKSLVQEDFDTVDALIARSLASDVPLINEITQHIIQSGGKRLRPLVVLLTARACGYQGQAHIMVAAIVEFIHTATLLHDDVVDRSELRRGRPTANALWDNAAAVLVGDFLYSRAFQLMVAIKNLRVMDILAEASNLIAQGEVLQLLSRQNPETSEAHYRQVIQYKTATLFEAAAQLGGVLSLSSDAIEQDLVAYGRHLGIAFQLMDDTLDYTATSAQLGKEQGDDLADGKPTLPLIYVLTHGNATEQQEARQALLKRDDESFTKIHALVESTGGIEYTVRSAQQEVALAEAALKNLPESAYKTAALDLCHYAVHRTY